MDFFRRAAGKPARLAVLAGTFNPPTRAHLALARGGLAVADEVVFVLPRAFPHKQYEGVGFAERVRMLELALESDPRCSIATTATGLFIDIARECRRAYGDGTEIYFLCGRDAAERAAHWDYGPPGAFLEQLREYQLLVAPRGGAWEPPPEMRDRIHPLAMEADHDEVSATRVRECIRRGLPWEHLAPASIVELVRQAYRNN